MVRVEELSLHHPGTDDGKLRKYNFILKYIEQCQFSLLEQNYPHPMLIFQSIICLHRTENSGIVPGYMNTIIQSDCGRIFSYQIVRNLLQTHCIKYTQSTGQRFN